MISTPLQIPTYAAGESVCPSLRDGLVGAWIAPLSPTGLTWHDMSGWHNHATLMSMDPGTDWVVGPSGWALDFPSPTNNFIEVGTKAALEFSTAFTLVVRCRHLDPAYDAGVVRGLMTKFLPTPGNRSYTYFLYHLSGKIRPFMYVAASPGTGSVACDSNFDLNDNEWHTLAFTFHAGLWTHYVDGAAVKSGNSGIAILNNASNVPFRLGIEYSSNRFHGQIDCAYAFRRALNRNEIRRLYVDLHAPVRSMPRVRMWSGVSDGAASYHYRQLMGV